MDREIIHLRKATPEDIALVVEIDYDHDPIEHIELKREEKITKAIQKGACFIILANNVAVGFAIFDYRFFDLGWIELIIVEKSYRGKGFGSQALDLICQQSRTHKVFTSTNRSNTQMQKALTKVGFSFAGKVEGLDEGDPELFYYKQIQNKDTEH